MGVDISTYRYRIGCFSGISGTAVLLMCVRCGFDNGLKTVMSTLLICTLLHMAGIELNPGPKQGQNGTYIISGISSSNFAPESEKLRKRHTPSSNEGRKLPTAQYKIESTVRVEFKGDKGYEETSRKLKKIFEEVKKELLRWIEEERVQHEEIPQKLKQKAEAVLLEGAATKLDSKVLLEGAATKLDSKDNEERLRSIQAPSASHFVAKSENLHTLSSDEGRKAPDASYKIGFEEISIAVSRQVKRSLQHYKVPITCWQDLDQSQKSIKFMLEFCYGIENAACLSKCREEADITEVDIYIDSDFCKIESLVTVPEHLPQCKGQLKTWNVVVEETDDTHFVSNFKGVLVDSGGPKFVIFLQGSYLTVKKDNGNFCIGNLCDETSKKTLLIKTRYFLERIIFEPLIKRCEFLGQVLDALNTASQSKKHQSEARDVISEVKSDQSKGVDMCFDETVLEQFMDQRDTIEDLFEEMVAAISRSHLQEESVLKIKRLGETRSVSREVSRQLFSKEKSVKGCGYRLKAFHVDVERLSTEKGNGDRQERIRVFLNTHNIHNVKFNFVSPSIEEYSSVGAQIGLKQDTVLKTGTLGCFANHSKGQESSLCVLLSKHVAQDCSSEIYLKDKDEKKAFGQILSDTNVDGGHDIVAAIVDSELVSDCDTGFKNIHNKNVPGELYRVGDTTNLQGQPIHLWGAKSKPGIGQVTVQNYHYSKDSDTYIEVKDGSVALGKPEAVLADSGDSGAIVCMDESGGREVRVLSMLMGQKSGGDSQDKKKKYLTLPLSTGLQTLEKRTNGKFLLHGTGTLVQTTDKVLDPPTRLCAARKEEDMHQQES